MIHVINSTILSYKLIHCHVSQPKKFANVKECITNNAYGLSSMQMACHQYNWLIKNA